MLTPKELLKKIPIEKKEEEFVNSSIKTLKNIFLKKNKIIIITGPCSVHCKNSVVEYAKKLKKLSDELKNIFIIMRCFFEKPRSCFGWKGYVYNPFFEKTDNLEKGLVATRSLLQQITRMKLPIAFEILNPLFYNYFKDFLSYAAIGSRTSTSQIHRQVTSFLNIPVGIKNPPSGDAVTSIQNILSTKKSSTFVGIDETGKIASFKTKGNPYSHLILRGSIKGPNYKKKSIKKYFKQMEHQNCFCPIIIDCSHDNSQKKISLQKKCFQNIFKNLKNPYILGMMLESFLQEGSQRENRIFGKSITDPCLSFQDTKKLLLQLDYYLSTSIKLIQN